MNEDHVRTSAELPGDDAARMVLETLCPRALYGFQIVTALNERSGGAFNGREGLIYPLLHGLVADGLLTSRWGAAADGKRRKFYRLSRRGGRFWHARTRRLRLSVPHPIRLFRERGHEQRSL